MSSSDSEDLFSYKPTAVAAFHQSPLPAAEAAEARPSRRPDQPQSKRARTLSLLDEDLDDEEDEVPVAAAVDAPVAASAPNAVDESEWELLPPRAAARTAVVLSEEERKLLSRTQQTLEELQRPVYEEPEAPVVRQPKPAAPPPPAVPAKKLAIFVRDATGDKQKFIIKTDTKFEAVFDAYCLARSLDRDGVRFFFDGDAVAPSATPAALDMDDEDFIDVKRIG